MVRVRFAPSPTGFPHIGNIRTALFNWLFARHNKGIFILRIEDTDVERRVEGAVEAIMDALRWLGLDWDEGPDIGGPYGPYIQSLRLGKYKAAAQKLLDSGQAYLCFCSPERLEKLRQEQMRRKEPPGYDRLCRDLAPEEVSRKLREGVRPVVRFRTPLEGETRFTDLIRGEIAFQNKVLDDFVILKSDGYPTYHLASVVDDHLMRISHVLRADEWLSSTPRHVLLYSALEIPAPEFAHLPIILGPDRSKLSKRHGATSVAELKEQGYLPEATVNYLALLGWALDEKTELFTMEELVKYFTLEKVSKTAAIFNEEKFRWMNGVYIRKLELEEFIARALPFWERDLPEEGRGLLSPDYLRRLAPFIQERARLLSEVTELSLFFFVEPEYEPGLLTRDLSAEEARHYLKATLDRLSPLEDFSAEALEGLLRPLASELGLSTRTYFGLLRVAVTGRTAAPPLFQTMSIVGRERCLRRLEAALKKLSPT